MQNQLTTRQASAKDIPVIQQLARNTWPSAYGELLSQEQLDYMLDMMYSDASLEKQLMDGHLFYIAELDEVPVGFASVSDESDGVFKLNKLYILPTVQRSGAGRTLLDLCTNHAKNNHGRQLVLQVNRQNKAKDFYARHGFSILQEMDLHVGNGYYMNDYIMGKDL